MSTASSNESRPPAQFEFSAGKPAASTKLYWALLLSMTLIAARFCFVFAYSASTFDFQSASVAPEVFALIKDHPVVVEHLGEFEDFDQVYRFESEYLDGDEFLFSVAGSNEWGTIDCISRTEADGTQRITSASLHCEDGETIILVARKQPMKRCKGSPAEDDSSQRMPPR